MFKVAGEILKGFAVFLMAIVVIPYEQYKSLRRGQK
jgi:hypothetical protein